jgi:L-ascorbate metabolism protein UlaG (beta-lactamase superfamily)
MTIMDITYLGHSSFKIKGKNATLITDPYKTDKELGMRFPKTSADIVTVSHSHPDHNSIEEVSEIKRVIEGPGEYEIMGVSIIGYQTFHDDKKGEERGKNTIFVFEMDGMRIAHLGDLGHILPSNLVEEIGTIDILMIPVGGFYTIDTDQAIEIFRTIDPSIIIPMHYKVPGLSQDLASKLATEEDFIKKSGLSVEKMDRLTVKKIDIPEEGQKLIVLERKV